MRIAKRLLRFWVIVSLLTLCSQVGYAIACTVQSQIAAYGPSFVTSTPFCLLGNIDPTYFLAFQVATLFLLFDSRSRLERTRIMLFGSAPLYNYYSQILIHEAIDAERFLNSRNHPDEFLEEWIVQGLTYSRFKHLYGVEPPNMPRSILEFSRMLTERNVIEAQLENAREQGNDNTIARLEMALRNKELELKRPVTNPNASSSEIPICS